MIRLMALWIDAHLVYPSFPVHFRPQVLNVVLLLVELVNGPTAMEVVKIVMIQLLTVTTQVPLPDGKYFLSTFLTFHSKLF